MGIALALAAAGPALPAAAQRSNSGVGIGPSQELSHPPAELHGPAGPHVEHLLGNQEGDAETAKNRANRPGARHERDRRSPQR